MTAASLRSRSVGAGLFFAILVFAGAVSSPVSADDLSDYLESLRSEYDLPALAAAVVKNGEITEAAAVGTRVYGGDIPVTLDDRFHLGSNTKAMTATLAAMMVEEGKLQWDSRVGDVLGDAVPDMSESLANVTLAQLLSHSSGVPADDEELVDLYFSPEGFDFNASDQRLRVLDAWKDHVIAVPDGSPFQYSNLGYMIVGMMVEAASGEPWESLMQRRIFAPLGLATAGIGPQATTGLIDAPVGHAVDDEGGITPMFWGASADVPPVMGPAGNAHMSITDYAKWAGWNAGEGQREPALITPETLAELHAVRVQTPVRENPPPGTPGTGAYGFGWGIVDFDWAERPLLTHNGSNSMNLARILIDPELDLAIVVATNFPGQGANAVAGAVLEDLYTEYAY